MAFPIDRLRTYLDGVTQIPAADLNTIQDIIIAMWPRARPEQRVKYVNPELFNRQSGWTMATAFPYADLAASTAGLMFAPLPAEVGERIISVRILAAALGNGSVCVASDINASLRRLNQAVGGGTPGNETTIVSATNLPTTAITMQKLTLTPAAPEVVNAETSYHLRVNGANTVGGKNVLRVEYVYDRV